MERALQCHVGIKSLYWGCTWMRGSTRKGKMEFAFCRRPLNLSSVRVKVLPLQKRSRTVECSCAGSRGAGQGLGVGFCPEMPRAEQLQPSASHLQLEGKLSAVKPRVLRCCIPVPCSGTGAGSRMGANTCTADH